MLLSKFPLTFLQTQKDAPFHHTAYDYSYDDIFKLGAPSASSEFGEQAHVGIDVYTPHGKYQVKPHSYPWFSATSAAAIAQRDHFFRLYRSIFCI